MIRQISYHVGFQSPVSPSRVFDRLLNTGYQTKKLRGVMMAYLLHSCKHLCM